jgi:tRNA(Arg) A34 adenosine deaminase TadA
MNIPNDRNTKFIKFLATEAKDQEGASRCRVAALLVHKNIPVAIGRNSMKSHPIMTRFGRTEHHLFLHAEIEAIIKASKELTSSELSKCTLYVCRVLADGNCAMARPCPGCQRAIKEYGIGKVIWTTETGYTTSEHEMLNDTNEMYEIRKNIRKHQMLYPALAV